MERASALGEQLECAREFIGDDFDQTTEQRKLPLNVIAFRSWSEMEEIAPYWNNKPVRLGGFYLEGEGARSIAFDLSAEWIDHIVAHELSHSAIRLNRKKLPVWLQEGLAEFVANTADGKAPSLPAAAERMLLTSVLSIRTDSREYNEASFHGAFYAQAALVAEYLWTNPERRHRLDKYLELTEADTPVADAIEQAFQMSSAELSSAIEEFANNRATTSIDIGHGCTQVHREINSVSYIDARARIAEMKSLVIDHRNEAIREFSTILRDNPKHDVALRGIAYALWSSGDLDRASEYFRLAAQVTPGDAKLHFYSAVLAKSRGARDPEARRQMRESLLKSVALDADFAEAHHWLSLTYAWDGDFVAASASGLKALELDRTNDEYKFNLAAFDARAHQWDASRQLCDQLRSARNHDVAARAELLLRQIDNETLDNAGGSR